MRYFTNINALLKSTNKMKSEEDNKTRAVV